MNLEEFVRIHNRNQLEIKLEYLLDKNEKSTNYNINFYLFFPYNLGINDETYSKKMFYDDLLAYVRLITPKINIEDIAYRTKHLSQLISKSRLIFNENFEYINYETRILLCAYRSFLRDFTIDIKKSKISEKEILKNLSEVEKFRKIIPYMNKLRFKFNYSKLEQLLESFCEFSSMLTELHLHQMLKYSEKNERYFNISLKLRQMIQFETDFKLSNNMAHVSANEKENEKFTFRYSVFKKFFYSILFLEQNRKQGATKVRHLAYAVAAGISMIFTTTVVFITQKKYGNFTTSFFVALVISYMFKDRIKDIFKHYFDVKLFFKTFDFKNKIYDSDNKIFFGCFKERVRMVLKDDLNKEVISKRLKGTNNHLSTWFLGEHILKYERIIKLNNRNIENYFKDNIEGINDIIRLNISNFTKKMDDPKVKLYSLDKEVDGIYAEKVYHLNSVLEFKSKNKSFLHKIRIILTKKGIKRIEIPEYDLVINR